MMEYQYGKQDRCWRSENGLVLHEALCMSYSQLKKCVCGDIQSVVVRFPDRTEAKAKRQG